ncbi:Fanconi anemia group M protein [Anopheles maculipalpis]|uniref:Fanconi anemia group M protein n=1 Tax=Anopheles maculipalpis TaxID=1496333 RepID=UPI002158FD38|nr:Fanconi anemia group M protein [Anopheles maculipalpis]
MAQNVANDSFHDIENKSHVLNQTSNSLHDASGLLDEPFASNEVELLDESVTDLLDDPYRLKLRRNSNYYGFDQSLGDSWIYPLNFPLRQYQFTITEAALFKNTLVVLPTGLGKTFIAAVVMYNIYRWYPTGKVIFMAPTRPLVSQQIEACYRIMGIPRSDTAEVTGKQPRQKRTALWREKRVFYATPQVVLADLESTEQTFPAQQVRLVVIDEAHKAKGRYAYTDVIRLMAERNRNFRVLALSATPGRTLEDVAEVIKNLLIAHVEVRWDNSIDVLPYVFRKDVRTIVIPLGQTILRLRKELLQLVNPYLQRLLESNVFMRYPDTVTPGMLIMEQKRFRKNALQQRHPNHSAITADFGVCISMYHALDLLVKHGIRTFLNFFDDGAGTNGKEKYFVNNDRQIKAFLDRLREQYQHRQQQRLDESSVMTGNDDIDFGHPKYRILEQQLTTFFKECPDSKAIVFCEFRDSVAMIKRMLSKKEPLIRPNCIVGQGGTNGGVRVPQHEQIGVMRHFRSGAYNTLIATCVAEEGIDVGEVDLIVCFDVAKNPVRFVQRIGRTGRQRVGRVLMLVTEGEEHNTLKHVLASKDKTNQQLARSKDILQILYRHSPPLLPAGLKPTCAKMFMNISDEPTTVQRTGSDSSDEEIQKTVKGSSRKRRNDRLMDEATGASGSSSKRRKTNDTKTRDVREYFQRQRHATIHELDVSECDVFALDSPNRRSKTTLHNRSHGNISIPIDQTIRHGQTEAEVAISALLKPLIRHYKQLCRQKWLYKKKLLHPSKVIQFERKESSSHVPAMDDPLDLPELVPHEKIRFDVGKTVEESIATDRSISDLFDLKLNQSETTTTDKNLWEENTRTIWKQPERIVSVKKSTVSVLNKAQKHCNSPKDLSNSPLLLAFNRSVKKRKNSDTLDTPARTNDQSLTSHSSNSQKIPSVSHKIVLEYFLLQSLAQIFEDDSSEEIDALDTASSGRRQDENLISKGTSISRRLFGGLKNTSSVNVPDTLTTRQEQYASATTIPVTTSDVKFDYSEQTANNQLLMRSTRMLESSNNLKRKNFDLGLAELVFQDESSDEYEQNSVPQPKSSSRSSSNSQIASSKFATLRRQSSPLVCPEEMYCLPGRSPYFVSSYAKLTPSQNGKKPNELKEPVYMQPVSDRKNETMHEARQMVTSHSSKLDSLLNQSRDKIISGENMSTPNDENVKESNELNEPSKHTQSSENNETLNESIVGRKVRRAYNNRIDSSGDSLKDGNANKSSDSHDLQSRLGDTLIDWKEEDHDIFQSAIEIRSPHASIHSNKQTKLGKAKKRTINQKGRDFLQTQAAVSDDTDDDVGEDSNGENSLESFVTASDDEQSTVDMRAVYLQSVRSPLVRRGGFKILSNRPNNQQTVNDTCLSEMDTQYAEEGSHKVDAADANGEEQFNSFIDDNIVMSLESDLSELEIAERKLKERRQKKKWARKSKEHSSARRKIRRIMDFISDSD